MPQKDIVEQDPVEVLELMIMQTMVLEAKS
jgi:hypothetical protein